VPVWLAPEWRPPRSERRRSPLPHLGVIMVVDPTHMVVDPTLVDPTRMVVHLTLLLAGVVATMRAVPGVIMHVNLLTPMAAALTQLRIGAIVSVLVPRPSLVAGRPSTLGPARSPGTSFEA
jgi:hypothetical protein